MRGASSACLPRVLGVLPSPLYGGVGRWGCCSRAPIARLHGAMRFAYCALQGGGLTSRALLQLLHQALQQPRARLDRGEQHVFMIRVCAVAIDAKPVQRWDAHRDGEIPVRSTADSCCALELEADLLCNGSSLVEHEVDCTPAHERRPRDLARHARLDVG